MNYAHLPWPSLTDQLYAHRLLDTLGAPSPPEIAADLWAEATRRVQLIARKGFRRTIPISDLEDVEQAVILKLLDIDVLRTAAGSRSPGVYIARMVRNTALDHLRRRSHDFATNASPLSENIPELPPNHEFDNAHVRSRFDQLSISMDELSQSDRELLTERFWNGLSIEQIAFERKLPYSTVAKRLFRAVLRLRSRMEAWNA